MKAFLQWKVVKIIDNNNFLQEENEYFTSFQPNREFYNQFGLDFQHCYVPYLLNPSQKFHWKLKGLLKKKLGVKLKQRDFLYRLNLPEIGKDVSLNIKIRLFPPSIIALTISLQDFELEHIEIENLINNQSLQDFKQINHIVNWILAMVDGTLSNSLVIKSIESKPFISLCGVNDEHDEVFQQHFDDNKLKYIGLLIRNRNYRSMPDVIPNRLIEANYELNLKSNREKLLIDRQGVLYLMPTDLKNKIYSRSRIHDLVEIALVFDEFLSSYTIIRHYNEDFADFILYKIQRWITKPNVVFKKSTSNVEIWKLLTEKFSLGRTLSDKVSDERMSAINNKRDVFDSYENESWWEDVNFMYVITRAVQEARNFRLSGNSRN